MANNHIVWADIPVADMDRASKFYAHVLGMPVGPVPGMDGIALFGMMPTTDQPTPPISNEPIVSADLYLGGNPGGEGTTIYFSAMGDINGMVARVREAGGEILEEPQNRGPMVGWVAFFRDSEGNRIGIQQSAER